MCTKENVKTALPRIYEGEALPTKEKTALPPDLSDMYKT